MNMLQGFIQRRYTALMLLLIIGGFVMMLAELIVTAHTDGIQLVGVVASAVGLLLALAALLAPMQWRNALAILFVLLSLTGVLGAYEHYEASTGEGEAARLVSPTAAGNMNIAYRAQEEEKEKEKEKEEEEGEGKDEEVPPPFAPLSLAGFGLMGAVATLGKRDE